MLSKEFIGVIKHDLSPPVFTVTLDWPTGHANPALSRPGLSGNINLVNFWSGIPIRPYTQPTSPPPEEKPANCCRAVLPLVNVIKGNKRMIIVRGLVSCPVISWATATVCGQVAPRLRIAENHRYLVYADGPRAGQVFFYLADTAWELFHRLTREEADLYLQKRAQQGFTVIQAVALAELDGLNTPNAYGHRPLENNDPTRPALRDGPRNDYWDHVDYVVDMAASLGLFVAMLPTWGDKWQGEADSPSVIFTPNNAAHYGQWLGHRYRDRPMIWILGGDRNIHSLRDRELMEAMAKGLREGDQGTHLISYHPRGPGRSSDYFHHADWLDFNMFQSSHGAAARHDNGLFTRHDYQLVPAKPTLDGEPRYEAIPVGFYNQDVARNLYFEDDDVRQAAWWSMLAGACGHTYGNNNVWQMWDTHRQPVLGAKVPWHRAIDHPGSFQMGHLRRLFESRPLLKLVPDDSFIVDGPERRGAKIRAARADDGSFAIVYSGQGARFTVRMNVIQAPQSRASWYNPRYGVTHDLHTGDAVALQTFVPPSRGRGQDWVLVLDDAAAQLAPPGNAAAKGKSERPVSKSSSQEP